MKKKILTKIIYDLTFIDDNNNNMLEKLKLIYDLSYKL